MENEKDIAWWIDKANVSEKALERIREWEKELSEELGQKVLLVAYDQQTVDNINS